MKAAMFAAAALILFGCGSGPTEINPETTLQFSNWYASPGPPGYKDAELQICNPIGVDSVLALLYLTSADTTKMPSLMTSVVFLPGDTVSFSVVSANCRVGAGCAPNEIDGQAGCGFLYGPLAQLYCPLAGGISFVGELQNAATLRGILTGSNLQPYVLPYGKTAQAPFSMSGTVVFTKSTC